MMVIIVYCLYLWMPYLCTYIYIYIPAITAIVAIVHAGNYSREAYTLNPLNPLNPNPVALHNPRVGRPPTLEKIQGGFLRAAPLVEGIVLSPSVWCIDWPSAAVRLGRCIPLFEVLQ